MNSHNDYQFDKKLNKLLNDMVSDQLPPISTRQHILIQAANSRKAPESKFQTITIWFVKQQPNTQKTLSLVEWNWKYPFSTNFENDRAMVRVVS